MSQLVVWRGVIVGEQVDKFETWMKDEGFDVTYLEEFKTLPSLDEEGNIISDSGGRNDLIFSINSNLSKFAIWRLQYGMSWWDDYVEGSCERIEDSSEEFRKYYIIPHQIMEKYNSYTG